jgi:acylphosphatase
MLEVTAKDSPRLDSTWTMPDKFTLVRRVVVEGAVQGVGYREFTRRAALRLNVSGWVRNRYDGAVEALLRGSPAAVEALIAEMRKGPRSAIVESLSLIEHDEAEAKDSGTFVIRLTR